MESLQEKLRFLIKNGWRLIALNTVENLNGVTTDIEKAYEREITKRRKKPSEKQHTIISTPDGEVLREPDSFN